jgi:hypothetical protein
VHRYRAWRQPRRARPEHPSRRDPHLRLPVPGPVPGLPPPDGRPGLWPRTAPARVLPVPAQPGQTQGGGRLPGPPRTVKAPETRLDEIVGVFFAEHGFGPGRADLLAAQLPATDAAAAAARDAQAASLQARLKQSRSHRTPASWSWKTFADEWAPMAQGRLHRPAPVADAPKPPPTAPAQPPSTERIAHAEQPAALAGTARRYSGLVPLPAREDAVAALRFRDPDLTPTPRGPRG